MCCHTHTHTEVEVRRSGHKHSVVWVLGRPGASPSVTSEDSEGEGSLRGSNGSRDPEDKPFRLGVNLAS